MSKDERSERWKRRKAHKVKNRNGKGGCVSGNKRYNRSRLREVETDANLHDQRMGRNHEAA